MSNVSFVHRCVPKGKKASHICTTPSQDSFDTKWYRLIHCELRLKIHSGSGVCHPAHLPSPIRPTVLHPRVNRPAEIKEGNAKNV